MVLKEDVYGKLAKPVSHAWLAYDNERLYVAIRNEVDPTKPIKMSAKWGQDDAVEVALRDPARGKQAPIFVLRGYPNGHFESSTESGISADAARKAGQGTTFAAKVIDRGRWSAEYRISWAALGIDPAKQTKFPFSLSARKTAAALWLMWYGARGRTWEVDRGGFIALERIE